MTIVIKTNSGNQLAKIQTLLGDYIEYEDVNGIWWKLTPTINEDIKFPFVIEPLNKLEKQWNQFYYDFSKNYR
jgi:hypothetical protein